METMQELLKQMTEIKKKIDALKKSSDADMNEKDIIIYEIYPKEGDMLQFRDFDEWYNHLFDKYILKFSKRELSVSYFEHGERKYFFVAKDEYEKKRDDFRNFILSANNFQRFESLQVQVVDNRADGKYSIINAGATTENFEELLHKEENLKFCSGSEFDEIIGMINSWKLY